MWKKFSALFVLSVFLLSMIPMAFAEDADVLAVAAEDVVTAEGVIVAEEGDTILIEDEPTIAPAPMPMPVKKRVLKRAVQAPSVKAIRADVKERVIAQRIADKPLLVKRAIANKELVKAREQYVRAKEHYLTVKKAYLTQKDKFVRAKEAYKKCKDSDTEECKEKRADIKDKAGPYLLHVADLVLKELDKVKSKIEASEDLSDEEIVEMVADLEEKMEEVEDAKAVIESIDEDSTKEEINEAAKTIKTAWRHTKVALKKNIGKLVNARLGNIILKTEKLEKRLYNAKDKLESKGLDVSDLDEMLDDFSAKLDTAADKYSEARELWSDANTPGEVDDVAKEVHALLKEAKKALKDARDLLRDVVREIKKLNKGDLEVVEEETEAEEEEAAEEEEEEIEEEEEAAEEEEEETTEEEEEEVEEVEEVVVEEELAKFRPDYKPGRDLGYFIWQGPKNVWTICASGDGNGHKLKGKITADDGFCRTKPYLYEKRQDRYRVGESEIRFRAWVGPHQDCLRFATASDEVSFDLYMDGESADLVYFGPDKEKVGSPVDLEGDSFPGCPADVSVESGYELSEDEYDEELTEEEIAVDEVVSDELDDALAEEVEEAAEEA